jgi:hypothetical protein
MFHPSNVQFGNNKKTYGFFHLLPTTVRNNWKGHAIIYLISNFVQLIPLVGPIIELSIVILAKYSKANKKLEKTFPHSYKVKQDKKSSVQSDTHPVKSPSIGPFNKDDVIGDDERGNKDTIDQQESMDDWEFAKKLEEQFRAEDSKKSKSPSFPVNQFNDDYESDWQTAYKLQAFFDKDVVHPDISQIASDQSNDFLLAKTLKTVEATDQILNTPGLDLYQSDDDKKLGRLPYYELVGEKLRAVITSVTKEFPQAISPSSLKALRDLHLDQFEQYLALKFKRFAQAFEFNGFILFPSDHAIKLHGLSTVFVLPMIISSFETFSSRASFFSAEGKKWIASQGNRMMISDDVSDKYVQNIIASIHSSDFEGPILLEIGCGDHRAVTIWLGPFLLYIDRQSGHVGPGIHVFHLPNKNFINEDFISEIVKTNETKKENCPIIERIVSELDATLIYSEELSFQASENCRYATIQAVLYALMAIRQLLDSEKNLYHEVDGQKWKRKWEYVFQTVSQEYVKWSNDDRDMIFNDLIDEIEEWLSHKNEFGKIDLRKIFADILTLWLDEGMHQSTSTREKVRALIQRL